MPFDSREPNPTNETQDNHMSCAVTKEQNSEEWQDRQYLQTMASINGPAMDAVRKQIGLNRPSSSAISKRWF